MSFPFIRPGSLTNLTSGGFFRQIHRGPMTSAIAQWLKRIFCICGFICAGKILWKFRITAPSTHPITDSSLGKLGKDVLGRIFEVDSR